MDRAANSSPDSPGGHSGYDGNDLAHPLERHGREAGQEGQEEIGAQGDLMVVKLDFKVGDRVQLSELGRSRYRETSRIGTVIKIPKPGSGGGSVEVLFDGNKQPTRIHHSYIELETP